MQMSSSPGPGFNAIAMVTANAVSLAIFNCTFVSATVSHTYSDISTMGVDAYIKGNRHKPDLKIRFWCVYIP